MTKAQYRQQALAIARVAEVICQIDLDSVLASMKAAENLRVGQDAELFAKAREPLERQRKLVEALIDVRKARWEMNCHTNEITNDANAETGRRFLEMLLS